MTHGSRDCASPEEQSAVGAGLPGAYRSAGAVRATDITASNAGFGL